MRNNRFRIYLLVQGLVIVAVILIFKFNPDLKIASVQAGSLFLLMPAVLIGRELLRDGARHKLWFAGMLQFWLLFALPIFCLRLFNWESNFADLSLLGVSGATLHYWSNKSYILMMAVTAWESWKNYRLLEDSEGSRSGK